MKEYIDKPFDLYTFVHQLFEDLSLTMPTLGVRFQGHITPMEITALGDPGTLKNKLFMVCYDLAKIKKDLVLKFSPAFRGDRLELRFMMALPGDVFPDPDFLPNWQPDLFHTLVSGDALLGFFLETGFVNEEESPAPPYDLEKARELYDREILGELFQAFFFRCSEMVPLLGESIKLRDLSETLRLSHTLKGSARGIFAAKLARKALFLEMAARGGSFENADELYKSIVQCMKEVEAQAKKDGFK